MNLRPEEISSVVTLASAALVIPYLLFSPLAGRLAKIYKKRKIVVWAKFAEMLIMVVEPIPLHTTGAPELVECAASRRIAGGELLHHHFRRYLQPRADQADGGVREVVVPGVRVLRVCKLHLFAGVQVNDGPRPQLDAALVGVVDQLLRRYHFSKRSAVRRVL